MTFTDTTTITIEQLFSNLTPCARREVVNAWFMVLSPFRKALDRSDLTRLANQIGGAEEEEIKSVRDRLLPV